jgi:peptidoglycan/LPS O-acetylase OafA/YrhL
VTEAAGRVMSQAPVPRGSRIPSLDGLRAVSIAFVVVGHGLKEFQSAHHTPGVGILVAYGEVGVRIFFCVSGFLITSLLMTERRISGRIDFGAFYLRRAFRILPAYWAFLLLIVASGRFPCGVSDLARALAFVTDYLPVSWCFKHTWSLSVEEQFYLFWPLTLYLAGERVALLIAVVLAVVAPISRLTAPTDVITGLHCQIDGLMVGVLLALSRERHGERWWRLYGGSLMAAASTVFVLIVSPVITAFFMHRGVPSRLAPLGSIWEAVAIGSIVMWAVNHADTLVGRALNWRPLVHVGLMSYSLYLWQQPFLFERPESVSLGRVAVQALAALACAELSYFLVERPFMALRRRVLARRAARASA